MSEDLSQSLSMLYLPIIGETAFSLYFLLYSFPRIKTNILTYTDILKLTNSSFNDSLKVLSAYGLIKEYHKNNESIVEIIPPLPDFEFFLEPVLEKALRDNTSSEYFSLVQKTSLIGIHDDYLENTSKFTDVFKIKKIESLEIDSNLNMEEFINSISKPTLKNPSIFTETIINTLVKIKYLYQLDISQLAKIFEKAYNKKERQTIANLLMEANVSSNIATRIVEIDNSLDDFKDDIKSFAKELDEINSFDILKKFGKNLTNEDYYNVTLLISNYPSIPIGVINCLLLKFIKIKKGILPTYNYLELVLQNWISKGTITTELAVRVTKNNSKGKINRSNGVTEDDFEDMYNDYFGKS
jgi:replication initiation and membrane attachment protein DnaB